MITALIRSCRRVPYIMGPQSSSTGAYQMRPQSSSTACNEIQPLFKGINLLKEYKELSNVNETLADKFFLSQIERLQEIIAEKDVRLKEKDLYANTIIAEKDIRLKEKDAHILIAKGW